MANRRPPCLYLVLDDWSSGYNIRKIALPSVDNDNSGNSGYPGEQPLPAPIFGFEAQQRGLPAHFTSAFGSTLIATPPVLPAPPNGSVASHVPRNFVPVFDVHARRLRYAPRPRPDHVDPIYIPVGDRLLLALSTGSSELLYPLAPEPDGSVWTWRKLPDPPFEIRHVTSYAVHPDGRTVFVSVAKPDAPAATFAFDTADSALENDSNGVENAWKLHGLWVLPFAGRAHFDPGLDGWFGFSRDDRGRLCACEVSDGSNNDGQCPAWKLDKERYFAEGSVEKHVGASLVHMGGRRSSRFGVPESFHINDDDGSARDETEGKTG